MSFSDTFTLHGAETAGEALSAHVSAETGVGWVSTSGVEPVIASAGRLQAQDTSRYALNIYQDTQASPDTPVSVDVYFPGSIASAASGNVGLAYRIDGGGNGYATILA